MLLKSFLQPPQFPWPALGTQVCALQATPASPATLTPLLPPAGPDQLVSYVVHDIGVVQAATLVWPPALDVDARLAFQVGQVEIVSKKRSESLRPGEVGGPGRRRAGGQSYLSVIWGRMGGVEETEARSPLLSASSSLEFWIKSTSSSSPVSFRGRGRWGRDRPSTSFP